MSINQNLGLGMEREYLLAWTEDTPTPKGIAPKGSPANVQGYMLRRGKERGINVAAEPGQATIETWSTKHVNLARMYDEMYEKEQTLDEIASEVGATIIPVGSVFIDDGSIKLAQTPRYQEMVKTAGVNTQLLFGMIFSTHMHFESPPSTQERAANYNILTSLVPAGAFTNTSIYWRGINGRSNHRLEVPNQEAAHVKGRTFSMDNEGYVTSVDEYFARMDARAIAKRKFYEERDIDTTLLPIERDRCGGLVLMRDATESRPATDEMRCMDASRLEEAFASVILPSAATRLQNNNIATKAYDPAKPQYYDGAFYLPDVETSKQLQFGGQKNGIRDPMLNAYLLGVARDTEQGVLPGEERFHRLAIDFLEGLPTHGELLAQYAHEKNMPRSSGLTAPQAYDLHLKAKEISLQSPYAAQRLQTEEESVSQLLTA